MTTALQIIDRAYSLLGFKAAGETLSSQDADYGLDALNSMVDSWNTQGNFIVDTNEVVATVTGISATIGTGMQFNTPRPTGISPGAFTRINGIDYPMREISREQYADLSLKTVTSTFPQYFYYDGNTPTGTVYFYPVPGSVQVHLPVATYLTEFADTSTDYTLAKGYRKAMEYSLAEELAPGIRQLDPQVMRKAATARRAIRRTNVVVPELSAGYSVARFNIYSGL